MYLLDTVVLSELRKKERDKGVAAWIAPRNDDELFISVISIGEISRGIERQRSINPSFSQTLELWLERLLTVYSDRIIPVSTPIARRWGVLSAQLGHSGVDVLLAATALEYGYTVVTRNERHFVKTGVPVLNPWTEDV
jgi:predicted nucleic acid-binding protein